MKKIFWKIVYKYYDWASKRAAIKYWKNLDKETKNGQNEN